MSLLQQFLIDTQPPNAKSSTAIVVFGIKALECCQQYGCQTFFLWLVEYHSKLLLYHDWFHLYAKSISNMSWIRMNKNPPNMPMYIHAKKN